MRRLITRITMVCLLSIGMCGAGFGQLTAQGTINATLVVRNGIAIVFYSDQAGVPLGASGTSAATLNMGSVSSIGPLSTGVTRSNVTSSSFTVSSPFDIRVMGGISSLNYTLTAQLTNAAPAGFTCQVDAITLTLAKQTVTTTGTYSTNAPHSLNLVISTAAQSNGGPVLGTPQTTNVTFIATAN